MEDLICIGQCAYLVRARARVRKEPSIGGVAGAPTRFNAQERTPLMLWRYLRQRVAPVALRGVYARSKTLQG